ncbi:MAG: asparagine synthase (glutamine-hydrolyzing) [Alphaproteobacteria bacterium]|nr:asparagine synthase (glutamine-hydrolyzing) [Alphaproteobacteria bacterium]
MCGIAGVYQPRGGLTADSVLPLREVLAHRGPDGGQSWANGAGQVSFGHRRLAIIDLSTAANQPMVEGQSGHEVALIFNGEIYNHAALRETLVGLGHTDWQTSHSDTEVILKAYRQWGMPGCLAYLRGMFALALWDGAKQELYFARDRAGEKPLYYTTLPDGTMLFGSEIKALLADGRVPRVVDEVALHDYLSFLMVPPPRTLLAGVNKLPAAHWAKVTAAGVETHRYWDALDAARLYAQANQLPQTEDAWVAHLEPLLRQSVTLRQEAADVPVGVFLSGGIDSSAVAALVGGHTAKGKLQTFAIGPDANYPSWPDETPYAERMAQRIGSAHTTVRLSEAEFLETLPAFIALQDEPVADPAALPVYLLAKAATKAGLKVCQGGEGGDEVFIGYGDWLKFATLERWNRWPVPRWLKRIGYRLLVLAGQGHKFWVEYLRRGGAGEPIFWGGAEAFTAWEKQQLLGPKLQSLATRSSFATIAPYAARFAAKPLAQRGFWNWCTWLELQLRLPEQLLMRTDKTTMATALELRVPLLDHVLIAAVLNTPEPLRAKGGNKKHLLKRCLAAVLPAEILNRRKQGLGMPLNDWVLQTYGQYARQVLEEFCAETGLLHWPAVVRLFAQRRGQHVWYLLNLALWYRHTIAQKPLEVPTLSR